MCVSSVADIYSILADCPSLLDRYESFSLRRALSLDPDTRWCPAPDCPYAVVANSCAACPQLQCERSGCGAMFCYHCKGFWHHNQVNRRSIPTQFIPPTTTDTFQTCDQARQGYLRELLDVVNQRSRETSRGQPLDEADVIEADPGSSRQRTRHDLFSGSK